LVGGKSNIPQRILLHEWQEASHPSHIRCRLSHTRVTATRREYVIVIVIKVQSDAKLPKVIPALRPQGCSTDPLHSDEE